MKKLICTLLTLAMLLGLAGCTTTPTGSADASTDTAATEPANQDDTKTDAHQRHRPARQPQPLTGEETEKDISGNCP